MSYYKANQIRHLQRGTHDCVDEVSGTTEANHDGLRCLAVRHVALTLGRRVSEGPMISASVSELRRDE